MALQMTLQQRKLTIQATFLFLSLAALSAIGRFGSELGILVVGALIALAFELTRIRYRENTLAITLVVFSTMTLIWGWIGPHIGVFSDPLAFVVFFVWGVHCLNSNEQPLRRRWSVLSISPLALSLVVYLQNSNNLISPLLFGYDNSAHVPALSQVYRHSGFLYSGTFPELFTFSNYVKGYPPLQSATWAFFMSVGNVHISGGYEILGYFALFFFGTGLITISLVTNFWATGLSHYLRRNYRILSVVLIGLLIAFSQASYVFWMGFPSFLWACCVTLAITQLVGNARIESHRIFILILGITLVNYSYPLLSPTLILVLAYELFKVTKVDLKYCWAQRKFISTIGTVIAVLNIAVVYKSLNVRHYLDDEGGIQPLEMRNLLPIVVLVLLMVIVSWTSLKSIPIVSVAFFSSAITFGVLAFQSQIGRGTVSYYPQKAGYLALILGFASMGGMLSEPIRFSKTKQVSSTRLLAISASVFLLWFSVSATSDPKLNVGFTSTKMVWDEWRQNLPNPGRACFHSAMQLTADLDSNSNMQTILYHDDLSTRWINGVRGRLTDATYSLSIPFGQGAQTLPEILENWFVLYPEARLLILAAEPPTGIEKWNDKIEYRQFSCA